MSCAQEGLGTERSRLCCVTTKPSPNQARWRRLRQDDHVPAQEHETAVVVPVPDAEPVVSAWRERAGGSAAQGMPAHVTALYPFLPEDRLGTEALTRLRRLCAGRPILDVEFTRAARFPGVLYLEPEPSDGLRQLTLEIAGRWPEAPPYRGAFSEIIPHLTVVHGVAGGVLDMIEARVLRSLPIATSLVEARLYVFDGERWRVRARLPFQPHPRNG